MSHPVESPEAQIARPQVGRDGASVAGSGGAASRGAGAVTVLVLLLLVGGVDPRSGAALACAAHVLSPAEGSQAVAREERPLPVYPVQTSVPRPSGAPRTAGVRPRSVVDGTLPAPRAPDGSRVG